MKLQSWNVNGLRAAQGKGFERIVAEQRPDFLLIQETKAHPSQIDLPESLREWHVFWNSAEKKGYSGVATFAREQPLGVTRGIGIDRHDAEGRVLTLEYPDFFLVNVYTPNAQDGLRRLEYRQDWDRDFLRYGRRLDKEKPVIFAGDLNVAHAEIDLARPKQNRMSPGFTDEERAGFDRIVKAGFLDSFRHFHPGEPGHYSWWSYRSGARAKNVGWRIDYFCVSARLAGRMKNAAILPAIMGSDHCPVELVLS